MSLKKQPGSCCGCGSACNVTVCVTGCPSATPISGASVGLGTGGTPCTTSGTGCCQLGIGTAGTYELIISAPGFITYDAMVPMNCGDTITVELSQSSDPSTVTFTVAGCCLAVVPGATVTLSNGMSGTTDAFGQISFWLNETATINYTVSASRYDPFSGSFSVTACSGSGQTLLVGISPTTGYQCEMGAPFPVPLVLHYSDSQYGPVTVTWNGTIYDGNKTVNPPAGCACPSESGVNLEVTTGSGCGSAVVETDLDAAGVPLCPFPGGGGAVSASVNVTSVSITPPYVLTGTISACPGVFGPSNGYPSGATVTITE